MPANILNLPQYRVLRVEESEHDYHITTEPVAATKACPHCQSDRLTSWGTREQVFKDMPMHGKRVGLYIDTKRLRCQSCSKTFSQVLPLLAENRMMTERLMQWIGKQSLKRTFTSLAEETGVVEGTIRNIFRDCVKELGKTVRFETPKWMGIDEIDLIKPRCVITNIQNNTIVDMLVNRNKDTVAKYLTRMAQHDKVQFVAMDMWTPYRDAVSAVMPQAKIVIDKFHVVRMANDAMEKARKGLRAQLTLAQRRGLMHDRFVLLKRERDLNDKERLNLDGWTKNYPVLGEAYRLKEAFYGIYEGLGSKEEVLTRYAAWHRDVSPEIQPYFADLIRAFTNWQPWILNYFDHQVTNAYTESLNSLIRVMDRMGRGYSFEALRAKILYTEGVHANKQARSKFERKREPALVGVGMGVPDEAMGYGLPTIKSPKVADQHRHVGPAKNYGANISTLTRLIEAGKL
ncbi:ISL3 family transposase [Rhodoferax antarcticus]|uniref:ISL3 family transposase n=1 Tax=Rhodoferax antarcticus TaxID=81479 RepID=UPI002224996C|nr:ISL3 family transposase [Rhodoferax antarcticus]MCW2310900.1 transposase [Rhodoferax antarcticus]